MVAGDRLRACLPNMSQTYIDRLLNTPEIKDTCFFSMCIHVQNLYRYQGLNLRVDPEKTSFRRYKRQVSRWNRTELSRKPYPDPWPLRVAKDSTGCWTRSNGVPRTDIIPFVEVFQHRFKKALYCTRGCCSFCIKVLTA